MNSGWSNGVAIDAGKDGVDVANIGSRAVKPMLARSD